MKLKTIPQTVVNPKRTFAPEWRSAIDDGPVTGISATKTDRRYLN